MAGMRKITTFISHFSSQSLGIEEMACLSLAWRARTSRCSVCLDSHKNGLTGQVVFTFLPVCSWSPSGTVHTYTHSFVARTVRVPHCMIRLRNLKYTVVLDFRFYDSRLSRNWITGWTGWKNNIHEKVNKIV